MTDRLKHKLTNGTSTILFRGLMTILTGLITAISIKGCNDWTEIKTSITTQHTKQEVTEKRVDGIDKRLYNVEQQTYFGKKSENNFNQEQ